MCNFSSHGGPNCPLAEELVWWGKWQRPLKIDKGWLCSWKCLVMRCMASHSMLPSGRSLGDLAASGPSSDVSGLQWGRLWPPAVLRVPVGSICSSSSRGREGGRRQKKCVCVSGTKVPLLPELCLILALWIGPDFSSAFLAYQVYIHHPECLFNPIRAVFSWGLGLSLMSAWG